MQSLSPEVACVDEVRIDCQKESLNAVETMAAKAVEKKRGNSTKKEEAGDRNKIKVAGKDP